MSYIFKLLALRICFEMVLMDELKLVLVYELFGTVICSLGFYFNGENKLG
ncbi:hypothetical protein Sjap_024669 [Stephania japonica]|uniref:Uncharacterized protein n=1 Tax=Stephania japonica TaxID=461633 RepID=A0AAP0EH21_9MAGN